jgi:hypothetical protein
MEQEEQQSLARELEILPKSIERALSMGVEENDIVALFEARKSLEYTVHDDFTFTPSVKLMAGIYTVCDKDIGTMQGVLGSYRYEDIEDFNEFDLEIYDRADVQSFLKQAIGQHVANSRDGWFEAKAKESLELANYPATARNIDTMKIQLYESVLDCTHLDVDKTPETKLRLQKRLGQMAFLDGFVPDFDLQAVSRHIEEDPVSVERVTSEFLLRGQRLRDYYEILDETTEGKDWKRLTESIDQLPEPFKYWAQIGSKKALRSHLGVILMGYSEATPPDKPPTTEQRLLRAILGEPKNTTEPREVVGKYIGFISEKITRIDSALSNDPDASSKNTMAGEVLNISNWFMEFEDLNNFGYFAEAVRRGSVQEQLNYSGLSSLREWLRNIGMSLDAPEQYDTREWVERMWEKGYERVKEIRRKNEEYRRYLAGESQEHDESDESLEF